MKASDPVKRVVPFCLCLCMALCCLLPAIAATSGRGASSTPIKLCILSDLHYLAASDQAAADGNEWRLYGESAPAAEEAIEAVIRQRPDVLLLTGDLTSGGGRARAGGDPRIRHQWRKRHWERRPLPRRISGYLPCIWLRRRGRRCLLSA